MKDQKLPNKDKDEFFGENIETETSQSIKPTEQVVQNKSGMELTKKQLENELKSEKKVEKESQKKMKDELKIKEQEEKKNMENEQEAEKKIQEEQEKQVKKAAEMEKKKREKADQERDKDNKERVHKMEDKLKTKSKRKPFNLPIWLRLFNLIVGVALVGITSFVIIDNEITLNNMINILTGLLVLLGVIRVINAFYDKDLSGNKRLFAFLVGSVLIISGIASYVTPDLGKDIIVIILSLALILQGITRILLGLFNNVFPVWYRTMIFTAGILSVAIPGYILYEQDYENQDVIRLLAYTFFFFGIARIGRAMTGIGPKKK